MVSTDTGFTGLIHLSCPPKGCSKFYVPPVTIVEQMPPNPTAPLPTGSVTPFTDKQFGYLNVYEVFPPHYPHQVLGACLAADASLQLPQLAAPESQTTDNGSLFKPQPCALWTYDEGYGTFLSKGGGFLDVSNGSSGAPARNDTVPTTLTISVASSTLAMASSISPIAPSPTPMLQHNLTVVSRFAPWQWGPLGRFGKHRFFQRSDDPGVLYENRPGHARARDWYLASTEDVERGGPLRREPGADEGRTFIVKFDVPLATPNGDWKPMPGEGEPKSAK